MSEIKKIFLNYSKDLKIYKVFNAGENMYLIIAGPLGDENKDLNSNFYLMNTKEKGVVCVPNAFKIKEFSEIFKNPEKYLIAE